MDGISLTPEKVRRVIDNSDTTVAIAPDALKKVKEGHAFLQKEVGKKVIYGITTGFGPMASHIIGKGQLEALQYNLIRSHAVGAGDPVQEEFVLAAMVSRLNAFLKGHSGVSEKLVEQLRLFINKRIIPVVPEHGAVGTSGDLVQLAHIALSLIGEGEAFYRGRRMPTKKVLQNLNIKPHKLFPKEGLSLINGTSFMTGIAALIVSRAEYLLELEIKSSALAFELVNGISDAVSEGLSTVRPHVGQREVARKLRELISSSKLLTERDHLQSRVSVIDNVYVTPEHIQDVYSFRCVPQILGPVHDIIQKVKNDVTIELNSVTDNPIIDLKQKTFLHGGNFHGEYVAVAVDQLKIGLIKLTILSERRVNFFLNRNVNQTFPPFLNMNQPGLTLALQGLQFVATSTTAQSQSLGYPHSLHSISTNADNQDVVSMGTDAALIAEKALTNAFTLQAIELITLAQAVNLLKVEHKLSHSSKSLFATVRKFFPVVIEDRSFSEELNALIEHLQSNYSSA